MDTVLISLKEGAGVVRKADGMILVTGDLTEDWGTCLRPEDPYGPESAWLDADRSVVGGLLAPVVASVQVIDDRGTRVNAAIGDGAYAAIVAQPVSGHEPVVCWRDAGGAIVRRPLPAEYPTVHVTDADEPCPACGAVNYDECVPTETWRGGRALPDGTTTPNPIVVCRVCGHSESEPTFYGLLSDSEAPEDDAERGTRLARARVLSGDRSEQMLTIDGAPEPFLTLTSATSWVAVRRHSDLTITLTGRDVDPSALIIEALADPAARLLGPQPPDPDAPEDLSGS